MTKLNSTPHSTNSVGEIAPPILNYDLGNKRNFGWSQLTAYEKAEVINVAQHYGLPFSSNPDEPIGIQRLFETTDGFTPNQLIEHVYEGMIPRRISYGKWLDPIFLIEDICGSKIHPHRLAMVFYNSWQNARVGFPLTGDPAKQDFPTYMRMVDRLVGNMTFSGYPNPTAIIADTEHDNDLSFFNSLSETLTVYRGSCNVPEETAAYGICWTTRKDIAEWFAIRTSRPGQEPFLLSSEVSKDDIILAMANEHEVVLQVEDWQVLDADWNKIIKAPRPESMKWEKDAGVRDSQISISH